MSQHRGRSRPFAARRYYWPRHCGCPSFHGLHRWREGWALFDIHVVRTVAPR